MNDLEDIVAVRSIQGRRPQMEDTYVLVPNIQPEHREILGAIFDGHSGIAVAKYAQENFYDIFMTQVELGIVGTREDAFKRTFLQIQEETKGRDHGGAVAVAFYINTLGDLTVANAGDAHILLIDKMGKPSLLTEAHRIDNPTEKARVVAAGAFIWGPYVTLPDGRGIQPTRTLGDHEWAKIGVLAEPATSTHKGIKDRWLVMACDGLFDFMPITVISSVIWGANTAKEGVDKLMELVYDHYQSSDNITIMVVKV